MADGGPNAWPHPLDIRRCNGAGSRTTAGNRWRAAHRLVDPSSGDLGRGRGHVARSRSSSGHHCAQLGPVTKLLAIGIEKVSGGHRNGTHSLLDLAVTTAIAYGLVQFGGWPLAIWLGFLLAVAWPACRGSSPPAPPSCTPCCALRTAGG